MKRRLFNILSALSLLVSLALSATWIGVQFRPVYYSPNVWLWTSEGPPRSRSGLEFGAQAFEVVLMKDVPAGVKPADRPVVYSYAGFRFGGSELYASRLEALKYFIGVPYYAIVVLASPLPLCWSVSCWRRLRAETRVKQGLCRTCGYDLRASKDRCPECGTLIPVGTSPVGEGKPVSR